MKHRIQAAFKKPDEPAARDPEILKKYLAGANWKNQGIEGKKGQGAKSDRKRAKVKVFKAPKEGWNSTNLGASYRSK